MRVQVITESEPRVWARDAAPAPSGPPKCWGGWRPSVTLGAASAGGLLLPDATPSASTLYAPRGVWIDDERVVVCDTGNHRVLIWHGTPSTDGCAADVVLGQPDESTEGPATRGAAHGLHLPTGVLIDNGRMLVADAWHHRVLVWDSLPDVTGTPPDRVLGQPDLEQVQPNRGGEAGADTFYWPFGIAVVDGRFYVADTGNRRVLVWHDGIPDDGRAADVVLGQPDARARAENRGGDVGPDSFRWPHAVVGSGNGGVLVADAGNHRILRWNVHPDSDRPADGVIGQPDFTTGVEFPYISQDGRLRFPYALAAGPGFAIADTANNRVLLWDRVPPAGEPADWVIGQRDFAGAGENRWDVVAPDSLCWPYGLARCGDLLAVADSGNNRVVIWRDRTDD